MEDAFTDALSAPLDVEGVIEDFSKPYMYVCDHLFHTEDNAQPCRFE